MKLGIKRGASKRDIREASKIRYQKIQDREDKGVLQIRGE